MSNWWHRIRKISRLPGARLAPETVLASTLEKSKQIKSVYISIEWEDSTFVADWSSMPRSALATHALLAQKNAMDEIETSG